MEKKGRYTRQGVNRLGSLLAAWLWLWLPAQATAVPSETDRQTYVSALTSPTPPDDAGFGSVVYRRDSAAFLGTRTGHSFPASCDWLPGQTTLLFWQSTMLPPSQRGRRGIRPILLRSIFEHQIAINAP